MLTYFLIGAAIGALTGVPIGPVNVAVIDTAYRYTLRRAVAVGFGGALGDGIYAAFGIIGVGPYLDDHPSVTPILYAVSGFVLIVYGALTARSRPPPVQAVMLEPSKDRDQDDAGKDKDRDLARDGAAREHVPGEIWAGFWLGLILIVANPAALITWVVIVGSFMQGVGTTQGIGATIGVSSGSVAWFTLVAYLANHGKKVLGGKAVWITRIVGVLLIGYGMFSLGRAIYIWFW